MRHLNVARLKAGAHYTGFIKKKKGFFREQSSVPLCRPGFNDIFDLKKTRNACPLRGKR
jgi:hypothetical protein